jgi:hypothetical protein
MAARKGDQTPVEAGSRIVWRWVGVRVNAIVVKQAFVLEELIWRKLWERGDFITFFCEQHFGFQWHVRLLRKWWMS